ncbi:phenylalanine--tRNA ligase alpha subunit-like [Watersipora subatra]|uniref:phenylalanine--tRNA ligase alpha subunit-like n=1 Tax=Watersipora subatra TaxID=2589382 RepID=UPI00355BEA0E
MTQNLTERILSKLNETDIILSINLQEQWKCGHQDVVGAIKSLQCYENVIDVKEVPLKQLKLTDEGNGIAKNGSHEYNVFMSVPDEGITQAELMKSGAHAKIGFSKAMQAGWIGLDKSAPGAPRVMKKTKDVVDEIQKLLIDISLNKDTSEEDEKEYEKKKKELKKRKLIAEETIMAYEVRKGTSFTLSPHKQEVDLTPEMIATRSWETKDFKPLNFDAMGVMPTGGYLHPLLKIRAEYRQIFLEMGFTEMPTNNFVESSFWNFDALFQPQQHPARDAHDTFFLSDPVSSSNFPDDYLARVKNVHSHGGYGSQGYKYDWKIEEAQKNILRTHTTAVSARLLYKLGQMKEFHPVRYFSIDRVFRNETLDMTHLAEFHQIEGVVADRGLTLGDLMGVINEFFQKLGMTQLRFKPAYNPYTEPSMEIFGFHDGLKKWVELGNSGIFRPEMLLPMGLPEDVVVIAWGLSLERPTMIKYGINNIRDLIGPKINLSVVQQNPICRLT